MASPRNHKQMPTGQQRRCWLAILVYLQTPLADRRTIQDATKLLRRMPLPRDVITLVNPDKRWQPCKKNSLLMAKGQSETGRAQWMAS